ncbi:MAG TPA: nuclear transport factor 2 family protein [Polyangiaceae bacterium]|nr:nuclear transport factor 2 family protein [Polyangiaceae bacterium]
MSDSNQVPRAAEISTVKTPREVWEHAVSHQRTRDIDGWVDSFAVDGVIEWPFTPLGFPRRAEGREAIRASVGPIWERAKEMNRKIMGHDRVVVHETSDPEVVVVEFDVVGEIAGKPFRQSLVYVVRARAGRIVLLRDYLDSAALNELLQTRPAAART